MPASLATVDHTLARATQLASRQLDAIGRHGVAITRRGHQVPAFEEALARSGPMWIAADNFGVHLPNWLPQPAPPDILLDDPDSHRRWLVQFRLGDVSKAIIDLFKLVDATWRHDIGGAYLVGAWTDSGWAAADSAGVEIFTRPGNHDTTQLFRANSHGWLACLTEAGAARPTRIPAKVRTWHVASEPLVFGEGETYRRRGTQLCVRVEPASHDWIPFSLAWFDGDWPVGITPDEGYYAWRANTGNPVTFPDHSLSRATIPEPYRSRCLALLPSLYQHIR